MPYLTSLIARLFSEKPSAAPAPAAMPASPAPRLGAEDQWSKLVGIVSSSIDRAAISQRCHIAAENQLDAAAYALSTLMDDLAAVMTLPARRPGTAVVRLQPAVVVTARRKVAAAA